MFKRLVWFAAGTAVGVAGARRAERAVRQQVERLAPSNVGTSVAKVAKGISGDIKVAVADGRSAMRSEQRRLEADFDPDLRNGRGSHRK